MSNLPTRTTERLASMTLILRLDSMDYHETIFFVLGNASYFLVKSYTIHVYLFLFHPRLFFHSKSFTEFKYNDIFRVWETLIAASHLISDRFELFIALALIQYYRDVIISAQMEFTDILKFFNGKLLQSVVHQSLNVPSFLSSPLTFSLKFCLSERAEKHSVEHVLDMARKSASEIQDLLMITWSKCDSCIALQCRAACCIELACVTCVRNLRAFFVCFLSRPFRRLELLTIFIHLLFRITFTQIVRYHYYYFHGCYYFCDQIQVFENS